MANPKWPTKLAHQRVLESSQTPREDGYDFTTVMAMMMENGEEVIWRTEGRVQTKPWGQVHRMENSISGMPPHMKKSDIPKSITRELRELGKGNRRRVVTKETIEFADGRTQSDQYTVEIDQPLDELVFADPDKVTEELRNVHERGAAPRGPVKPGKLVLNARDGDSS